MANVLYKFIYRPEGAKRAKSVIIKNPRNVEMVGVKVVVGVNFEDQTKTHIIQEELIEDMFEVVQDKMYGGFKKAEK